jgi:hypothetical protein
MFIDNPVEDSSCQERASFAIQDVVRTSWFVLCGKGREKPQDPESNTPGLVLASLLSSLSLQTSHNFSWTTGIQMSLSTTQSDSPMLSLLCSEAPLGYKIITEPLPLRDLLVWKIGCVSVNWMCILSFSWEKELCVKDSFMESFIACLLYMGTRCLCGSHSPFWETDKAIGLSYSELGP